MNRIILSLTCVVLFFLVSSTPTTAQNYRLIDLKNPAFDPPSLDYYILDVFDSRELQSSIGIAKTGDNQEIVMLDFTSGFYDELKNYFNNAYPAQEGKIPIILNFKKLWVTEFDKEGSTYRKCEIAIEFLTPKKQKFYECTNKNEMELSTNPDAHKDNVTVSLNSCMHYLVDTDIQKTYYAVLNSGTPALITKQEPTETQNEHLDGSQNKEVYSASKTRISIQGGYTYRITKIPEGADQEFEEHYKRLKNSFHIGTDINYFWNEKNSLGVSASFSQAKSTLPDMQAIDALGNIIAQGDLNENIKLLYVGPSYFNRTISPGTKTHLLLGFTMGYYAYNEKLSWIGETIYITGGTVGFGFSIGADFLTSDNFAIGLQASLLVGWLNKIKIDGEEFELEESENLSRLDLTIGFRFLP